MRPSQGEWPEMGGGSCRGSTAYRPRMWPVAIEKARVPSEAIVGELVDLLVSGRYRSGDAQRLAAKYGVPRSRIYAYKREATAWITRSYGDPEQVRATVLADLDRYKAIAEDTGDIPTAIRAVTEFGKAARIYDVAPDSPSVTESEEFKELLAVIVEALRPYPEAAVAVARAIEARKVEQ